MQTQSSLFKRVMLIAISCHLAAAHLAFAEESKKYQPAKANNSTRILDSSFSLAESKVIELSAQCKRDLSAQISNANKESGADAALYSTTFVGLVGIGFVVVLNNLASTPVSPTKVILKGVTGRIVEGTAGTIAVFGVGALVAYQLAVPAGISYGSVTAPTAEELGALAKVDITFNSGSEIHDLLTESVTNTPGLQTQKVRAQCEQQLRGHLSAQKLASVCNTVLQEVKERSNNGTLCRNF